MNSHISTSIQVNQLTSENIQSCLYTRPANSHKGTYGYTALIGGNICYSGAIRLANMANCAMRSGAGVVKLAAPYTLKDIILPNILESTFYPLADDGLGNYTYDEPSIKELMDSVSTIAVGMGIGNSSNTEKLIKYLLENFTGILLIDADGLNALSALIHKEETTSVNYELLDNTKATVIITPHPKEFSRISGISMSTILESPIESAYNFSKSHNIITLLKGHVTYVCDSTNVYSINRGCPGMATAGSGDVLSGVIAAICGYNKDNPLLATACAAYIAGYAGELAEQDYGSISMVASDTAKYIATAIKELSQQ